MDALERAVTPKSLILDLLRVSPQGAIPVRALVAAGEVFGLTGGAVRVALARLAAAGLVMSDERGRYCLTPTAEPLSRHVESWRDGGARVRPWQGHWLLVLPDQNGRGRRGRAARAKSERALFSLGFRHVLGAPWVRPDNLAETASALEGRLHRLGLEPATQVLELSEGFAQTLDPDWQEKNWAISQRQKDCAQLLAKLEKSAARLPGLPLAEALGESFLLGGAAIGALALDPLLPEEIEPGEPRWRLTEAMLRYDELGKRIWQRPLGADEMEEAPAHLGAMGASASATG